MNRFFINRRTFLTRTTGTTAAVAAGGLEAARNTWAAANPFAYELGGSAKTDPKLVAYEQEAVHSAAIPEPRRVEIGPDGRVYIAGRTGLAVLDRKGTALATIPLPNPARCVAASPEGDVYVGTQDHIEVLDHDGRPKKSWDSAGRKTWITGIALGQNELFAADSANRMVLRYDRSGKLLGRIGEKSQERNVPGLIVPSPYLDVALGQDGLLRVNNPGRHRIELYTPAGELELFWGKPSVAIEGFCGCCNPIALAMMSDGRCVTCEKGLPRVKVYSAQGVFECVVAGPEAFPRNARPGENRYASDGTMGGLDAAVDADGRVWILDLMAEDLRVMKRKTTPS